MILSSPTTQCGESQNGGESGRIQCDLLYNLHSVCAVGRLSPMCWVKKLLAHKYVLGGGWFETAMGDKTSPFFRA